MSIFQWFIIGAFCLSVRSTPSQSVISETGGRESRHFSRIDVCDNAICDQVLRQAQGLSRLKLIRRYVRDTVISLDKLVTALDKELVDVGRLLQKSLGKSCRGAISVLNDVTEENLEKPGKIWL